MELLPELAELGTSLIEGGEGSSVFSNLFNFSSSEALQNNFLQNQNYQQLQNFGQQRALQNATIDSANQLQTQRINFSTQTNQTNNDFQQQLQQNQFAHSNDMQQAQFNQAQQMQNNAFANNIKANALGSAVNLGGNLLSSGVNYLMTSSLINQQAQLQRQNFDYMTGKAEDAYTQAGLPDWLAFGGNASLFPKQVQQISGTNSFASAIPGNSSSLIWTGSSSQLALGTGAIPSAT